VAAKRDYYDVLGVTRDASRDAIKDAFRRLALKYHPDRNKAPDAEAKFKEIAEAYAVLQNVEKRAAYDTGGHAGMAGFTPEDLFGGMRFDDLFADLGVDLGGFGFFDGLFRRGAGPRHGADIRVEVVVPLATIDSGGERTVAVAREARCPDCGGTGAAAGTQRRACKKCKGSGRLSKQQKRGNVSVQEITTCPECRGAGSFIGKPCPRCTGTGLGHDEETLTVRIPAGAEEGMALRLPGRGERSAETGGQPGDLYVVVRSEPDPRFERHGANLWRRHPLEIVDAVLGCKIKVPTLDCELEVDVPAGTQPDSVLRLAGKGLPHFGAAARGDLFLRMDVHVPEHLTRDEQALYEQLRRGGQAARQRAR
jgi:molecular chaperone DnaJ